MSINQTFSDRADYISSEVKRVLESSNKPFFFVGAGASVESELPSWEKFISKCVERKFDGQVSPEDLAKLFGSDQSSLHLIDSSIMGLSAKDELHRLRLALYGSTKEADIKKIRPSTYHFLLVQIAHALNIPIVTLNFDHLFEVACVKLGLKVRSVYSDRDLKKIAPKTGNLGFTIIHLHGYLGPGAKATKQNLVAGQLHYYREYVQGTGSSELMLKLLSERTGIFLGLSLTDHNLNRFLFKSKKGKKRHLWLTRLGDLNLFLREEHERFWQQLGIRPLYCSEDFSESYASLRRIANHRYPKTLVGKGRSDYFKLVSSFYQSPLVLKLFGPFDHFEIDVYEDNSDSKAIRMVRVGTYTRKGKQKARPREFSIDWKDARNLGAESAVAYVMDSLSPFVYVKSSKDKMRSWALVFIPIFSPYLGRLSQIIALKYLNKNNVLNNMVSGRGLNPKLQGDIKRAVGYINKKAREFNKL